MTLWRMIEILFVASALAALVFGAAILTRKASGEREWSPPLAKVASFQAAGDDRYTLENVRAWEYGLDGPLRKEWETAAVTVGDIAEVWFFIEPFAGNPLFAHSFLSFVFEDAAGARQTLSISVEARKEANEAYSAFRGALRAYELLYVWSTEKDVLSRIAIKLDHTLYAYKLELTQDQAKSIFEHFVKRTNELAAKPRFYNTLHSNCTNELAKAVNDAYKGALPWHRSWVMTGRSAKWLYRLGFIGEKSERFEALTRRSDIQPFVKEFVTAPGETFSQNWRGALGGVKPSPSP